MYRNWTAFKPCRDFTSPLRSDAKLAGTVGWISSITTLDFSSEAPCEDDEVAVVPGEELSNGADGEDVIVPPFDPPFPRPFLGLPPFGSFTFEIFVGDPEPSRWPSSFDFR